MATQTTHEDTVAPTERAARARIEWHLKEGWTKTKACSQDVPGQYVTALLFDSATGSTYRVTWEK